MTTVTAEDAQTRLQELLDRVAGGEGVVITRGAQPVARLVAEPPPRKPRVPGSAKGVLTIVSDDDEHLADFAEYME